MTKPKPSTVDELIALGYAQRAVAAAVSDQPLSISRNALASIIAQAYREGLDKGRDLKKAGRVRR